MIEIHIHKFTDECTLSEFGIGGALHKVKYRYQTKRKIFFQLKGDHEDIMFGEDIFSVTVEET